MTAERVQLQHASQVGAPCTRCGLRCGPHTVYIPCYVEGDTLDTWLQRNADQLRAAREGIPDLLREMLDELEQVEAGA
jgi:hypothetical protein